MDLTTKNIFLCAVDADILAYRVAAACEEEDYDTMVDTLRAAIYRLWKGTRAQKYIFCLTGKQNFRNEVAVTHPYKGNRKDVVRPRHLTAAKKYILDNYTGLLIQGYEADDLVVSAAHRFGPANTIIASIDKDLKQCSAYHYNFVKNEATVVSRNAGERFMWTQVLTGDATDTIKGLPNVGPKKADAIINRAIKEGVPLAYAVEQAYLEKGFDSAYFLENLRLIRMLVDIPADFGAHMINLEFSPDDFEDGLQDEDEITGDDFDE